MATQSQQIHSLEEYLDLEEQAGYRSEYHAGNILAMSGGTATHSRLSARMVVVLDRHLSSCSVYDSSLKLYIQHSDRGLYPDAMAVCEDLQFVKGRKDIILNPAVVVEVLSPSTEKYDRGTKSDYYRAAPSVQHILLVSQDEPFVDHFARQTGDNWTITRYMGRDKIPLLGTYLPLEEIFQNIR